jgi:hypothetical protein
MAPSMVTVRVRVPSKGVVVDAGFEAPLHAAREDVSVVRREGEQGSGGSSTKMMHAFRGAAHPSMNTGEAQAISPSCCTTRAYT